MGVDPNNHRMSRTLPSHQQKNGTSSATSSGSKSQVCQPCQLPKSNGENDQMSDAASCLDDDKCTLPDLNLDLTIAVSAPPLETASERPQSQESKLVPSGIEDANYPALVLFRWLDVWILQMAVVAWQNWIRWEQQLSPKHEVSIFKWLVGLKPTQSIPLNVCICKGHITLLRWERVHVDKNWLGWRWNWRKDNAIHLISTVGFERTSMWTIGDCISLMLDRD